MGVNFRGPFCQLIKRALKTQTQLGINQKKKKTKSNQSVEAVKMGALGRNGLRVARRPAGERG